MPNLNDIKDSNEIEKKLVCNVTNFKAIAKKTGKPDSDDWVGETIDLWFNPDIEFGGDIVGGIRLMTAQPQAPVVPTQVPPVQDTDIPF
jgi:hypothetical protein